MMGFKHFFIFLIFLNWAYLIAGENVSADPLSEREYLNSRNISEESVPLGVGGRDYLVSGNNTDRGFFRADGIDDLDSKNISEQDNVFLSDGRDYLEYKNITEESAFPPHEIYFKNSGNFAEESTFLADGRNYLDPKNISEDSTFLADGRNYLDPKNISEESTFLADRRGYLDPKNISEESTFLADGRGYLDSKGRDFLDLERNNLDSRNSSEESIFLPDGRDHLHSEILSEMCSFDRLFEKNNPCENGNVYSVCKKPEEGKVRKCMLMTFGAAFNSSDIPKVLEENEIKCNNLSYPQNETVELLLLCKAFPIGLCAWENTNNLSICEPRVMKRETASVPQLDADGYYASCENCTVALLMTVDEENNEMPQIEIHSEPLEGGLSEFQDEEEAEEAGDDNTIE